MNGPDTRSDGELLTAFAGAGDQSAFAALVKRHGPMVHGVCSRVLGDHHEAQDVAQAVFLTLARKAASLRMDASVGGCEMEPGRPRPGSRPEVGPAPKLVKDS